MTITFVGTEVPASEYPDVGTRYKGTDFERWYTCVVCGHDDQASGFGFIHGKPYCLRYGDYQDMIHDAGRRR